MPQHNTIGLHKFALDTPCLIIDIDALKQNLTTMQRHAAQHKIDVRPHCKTHKCSTLAALQIEHGAIGVCATKVSEAAVLIQNGILSVLITSPVVTQQKINHLSTLIQQAPSTIVVTDHPKNVADLNEAGKRINQRINVLVDIDPGIGRTGVKPEHAVELGLIINQCKWLNLLGIQCYAGNLQHILSYDERKQRSLNTMEMASNLVLQFKANGLACPILTGTGTGTYDIDSAAAEVTDIQPGSYAVIDVEYSVIQSKDNLTEFTTFNHAMTLLTTVISSNRTEWVTVDAGTKSIYVDKQHKPKIINHNHLEYDWAGFGDEHGKITAIDHSTLPKNGAVLELIVPHCDPTINLFDKFYITQQDHVIDVWDIDMRGKSQ